jgi:hypothetical protein
MLRTIVRNCLARTWYGRTLRESILRHSVYGDYGRRRFGLSSLRKVYGCLIVGRAFLQYDERSIED